MTVIFQATPSYVSFNDGNFDTRYRYFRASAESTSFSIVNGATYNVTNQGASNGMFETYNNGRNSNSVPANTPQYIDVGSSTTTTGTSLDITPSGVTISDPASGRLLFDPSAQQMHVLNEITGSVSFAASNGNAFAAINTTVLGSCDSSATHVVGAIRTTYSSSQPTSTTGQAGTDWWFVNGSCLIFMDKGNIGTGNASGQIISSTPVSDVAWSMMTFRVSGGQILMDEWTYLYALYAGGQFNPTGGGSVANYIRQAYTLYYQLKAVVFT